MKTHDWYSVEQVADRLGLHVRTVRNYVRDGRLNAVRIGKQYRIAHADLAALTGRPAAAGGIRQVDVTSVVDIDGIGVDAANRIAGVLAGLPAGPGTDGPPPRIEVVHDPDRARLKIIIVGGVGASVELLRFVGALAEDES